MTKVALLIGVSDYQPGLNSLPAAVRDIEAMEGILQHPEFGAFDQVKRLPNPGLLEMRSAIAALFSDRDTDDLVLLYFSGHGVTDEYGKFFLTNCDTQKAGRLNKATVVEAGFVHDLMENCDSERQVIILDCCHSGAFSEGMKARDAGRTIDFQQQLGGRGRIVLTSSAATEYSFEREGEDLAIYTRYLVEGIQTGAADLDGDGAVSVNELHDYVREKVRKASPAMQPERYIFQDGEKILLSKAPVSDPQRHYRQEVQKRIRGGKLSSVVVRTLREIARQSGLTSADAAAIEAAELKPYQELQQKLDNYREAFLEEIQATSSLSKETRSELQDYQQVLGLRNEDIQPIESEVLTALSLNAELDQIEDTIAPSEVFSPIPSAASPPSSSPTFEFEAVTLEVQTSSLSGRNTELIQRSRPARAEYFRETLGNNIFLDMVSIPGGSFQMGAAKDEEGANSDEYPQHSVTIAPFYMGKFAITQEQWSAIATLPKINHDLNPDPSNFKGDNRPVEQISWFEAVEFCDRLTQKTRNSYRLASEAEWEYACRAGTTTPFHFGETILTDLANYRGTDWEISGTTHLGNYGDGPKGSYREQTTDVGSFSPNAFGLYDMHGNVWEWCSDRWHDTYQGAPINGSAWETGDSESRLLRGGSWYDFPWLCRSAFRLGIGPDVQDLSIGFRVVCASA